MTADQFHTRYDNFASSVLVMAEAEIFSAPRKLDRAGNPPAGHLSSRFGVAGSGLHRCACQPVDGYRTGGAIQPANDYYPVVVLNLAVSGTAPTTETA